MAILSRHLPTCAALALTICAIGAAQAVESASIATVAWGHSHLGAEYDEGPRSRPWEMAGIGRTHFPITTAHPEVQKWFDQANTLLHGFWYFEAERSFRWCLKLDPECAMAYWGLARCAKFDNDRARAFLKEASARKERTSPRERDYIDLWEAKLAIADATDDREDRVKDFTVAFDRLLMKYPDDVEAKCLYWLELPKAVDPEVSLQGIPYRYAMEGVLQDALRLDPGHVGALHYRIHNWDSAESNLVVDSCRRLRDAAPNSGHLQHMPGHIYSELGRWHEAAAAMDTATRIEKAYMHRRLIVPEQNWDYFHNLSYLCYIQEQLGMFEEAVFGAQQLALGPRDVEGGEFRAFRKIPMMRALLKSENWDAILNADWPLLTWDDDNPLEQFYGHYARTLALLGTQETQRAAHEFAEARTAFRRLEQRQTSEDPAENDSVTTLSAEQIEAELGWKLLELEGRTALAQGDDLKGIEHLTQAAKLQAKHWKNDPPNDPVYLYTAVGEAYLNNGSPALAAQAFERTLERVVNDGFALSGLTQAYSAMEKLDEAQAALARLENVWSDADEPNRWLLAARQCVVDPPTPNASRMSYRRDILDQRGPSRWERPAAPELTALDSRGRQVALDDYAGRHVVLIFYQGGQCVHCMEQMRAANSRAAAFRDLGADIVAVSKDDAETISGYETTDFNIRLLSDKDFANARRFNSYDDFEEIELHSTLLIDDQGRIHWSRHGGDPFMNFDFLQEEIERLNRHLP